MADILLEEERMAVKEELNDTIHPLMKSSRKKDFMEDSFKKSKMEKSEPHFSTARPLIRPKLVTSGFEEFGDYKVDWAGKSKSPEIQKLPRAGLNPLDLSTRLFTTTPSPNHLKGEIKFYNDTLLVISILMEMYQALIEELKLPSSKIYS